MLNFGTTGAWGFATAIASSTVHLGADSGVWILAAMFLAITLGTHLVEWVLDRLHDMQARKHMEQFVSTHSAEEVHALYRLNQQRNQMNREAEELYEEGWR